MIDELSIPSRIIVVRTVVEVGSGEGAFNSIKDYLSFFT